MEIGGTIWATGWAESQYATDAAGNAGDNTSTPRNLTEASQELTNMNPLEAGWEIYTDIGALCPACAKEYQTMVSAFMKGVEGEVTTPCATCDDYAGDGMTCASGYLVFEYSTSADNCKAPKSCTTCAHERSRR